MLVFQSPPLSHAAILSQLPAGVAVSAGAAGAAPAGLAGASSAWRPAYEKPSATRAARVRAAATATRNSRLRGVRVASRYGRGFSSFGGRALRDLRSATQRELGYGDQADHEKITLSLSESALVIRLNYASITKGPAGFQNLADVSICGFMPRPHIR